MLQEILKNRRVDRRQALAIVTTPAFAGIDFSELSRSAGIMSPEQFLSQCNAAIDSCWRLLRHGEYSAVEALLHEIMPTLLQLANTDSEHQKLAASHAVQAKILQIQLATRNLDFTAREAYCSEAVRFGRISGKPFALAVARYWQADTHTYCYRQPQTAIDIFDDALAGLSSEAMLIRSRIYSDLSIAHAQKGDETKALKCAEMARNTWPKNPELDLSRQYIRTGLSELDQYEGRAYLYLTEHFPKKGYARQAYEAFDKSITKQATTKGYLGQILIRKADAAVGIGSLDEFAKCLKQGAAIAFQIDSKNTKSQARTVLEKAPDAWKNERKYQNLVKMFGLS